MTPAGIVEALYVVEHGGARLVACLVCPASSALGFSDEKKLSIASLSQTLPARLIRVALGLHPQLVGEREEELAIFERHLPEARYVGEVGLDAGPRFFASFSAQERVFERVLRACAEQRDKILTVHSVRATAKVLGHIERALPPERGRAVLHWFTGTLSEARRAAALGCYFSINGEMLRSPKHRKLVSELPADRLLTETDGPFVERDGRPARPRDVAGTVSELALLRGEAVETTARRLLENLRSLLRHSSAA